MTKTGGALHLLNSRLLEGGTTWGLVLSLYLAIFTDFFSPYGTFFSWSLCTDLSPPLLLLLPICVGVGESLLDFRVSDPAWNTLGAWLLLLLGPAYEGLSLSSGHSLKFASL